MKNILKITRFNLVTMFRLQTIILCLVLLLNVIISVVVTHMVSDPGPQTSASAGSLDPVVICWMLVLGITFFPVGFKFMLSYGVSRKKFFLASNVSIALMALLWGLLITAVIVIARTFTGIWAVYELMYHNLGFINMAVWEFATLLLFAVLGWFFYLIYYRSGFKTKLAITAAPFVVAPLLVLLNMANDGRVFRALEHFFSSILGLASETPNSYIGAISLLVLAFIFSAFNFLLLRRAQVKD